MSGNVCGPRAEEGLREGRIRISVQSPYISFAVNY